MNLMDLALLEEGGNYLDEIVEKQSKALDEDNIKYVLQMAPHLRKQHNI
jgi:hypothetical protein